MIKVTSKINLNFPKIKQLTQAQVNALEKTAEALHSEVAQAQVVPRMDGTLQGEAFFVDYRESRNGKVSLVHSTPYARRMYFHPEYHFHKEPWADERGRTHDGNPNAKGKWFEDWLPNGKYQDFTQKAYREFYRRLTGV